MGHLFEVANVMLHSWNGFLWLLLFFVQWQLTTFKWVFLEFEIFFLLLKSLGQFHKFSLEFILAHFTWFEHEVSFFKLLFDFLQLLFKVSLAIFLLFDIWLQLPDLLNLLVQLISLVIHFRFPILNLNSQYANLAVFIAYDHLTLLVSNFHFLKLFLQLFHLLSELLPHLFWIFLAPFLTT